MVDNMEKQFKNTKKPSSWSSRRPSSFSKGLRLPNKLDLQRTPLAKSIAMLITISILLEVNKTRDSNVQAKTHTQRHMDNAWSKIVLCSPCFAIYCSFLIWFIQTIWDNSYLSSNQYCGLVSHVSSITFLLTTSNLMFYFLHSHFASSQRLQNPLPLLMLDAYPL